MNRFRCWARANSLRLAVCLFAIYIGRHLRTESPIGGATEDRQLEVISTEDVAKGKSDSLFELLQRSSVTEPDAVGFRLTVSGIVRDANGDPVANTLVALREDVAMTAHYLPEMAKLRQQHDWSRIVCQDVYAKTNRPTLMASFVATYRPPTSRR